MSVSVLNVDASLSGKTIMVLDASETVTGVKTFGANVLFIDNAYDIGAAGASRPRAIYVADTITAGGHITTAAGKKLFLDGGGDTYIIESTGNQIDVFAGGTSRLTVASAGVSVGATVPLIVLGGQVKFPAAQNPSADVNTLDDYEEGTWTPVIGGATSESGQAYSAQTGAYVKIGKHVHCSFDVTLSTKGTITGSVIIKGLPFTVAYNGGGSISYWGSMTTAMVFMTLEPAQSSTTAWLYSATAAATTLSAVTSGDLSNTTRFIGSFNYVASA